MAVVSVSKQAATVVERAELAAEDPQHISPEQAHAVLMLLGEQATTPQGRNAVNKAVDAVAALMQPAAPVEADDDPLAALLAQAGNPAPKPAAVATPAVKLAPEQAEPVSIGGGVSILASATYADKAGKRQKYSGGPSLRIYFEGQRAFLTIKSTQLQALRSAMRDDGAQKLIDAAMINAQTNWNALA